MALSSTRLAPAVLGLAASALLFVSACVTTNGVRVGWTSSVSSTEYSAQYAEFSGSASVPISVRETAVVFSYQIVVRKGALSIQVKDPGGQRLWQTTLKQSGQGSRTLATPRAGSYTLEVDGQDTGGSFDIHWR
jgi:hypothetical protein